MAEKINIRDIHKPLRGATITIGLGYLPQEMERGYILDSDMSHRFDAGDNNPNPLYYCQECGLLTTKPGDHPNPRRPK